MKGSWRVAQVAGVDFYVHWSFGLIIPWVIAHSAWSSQQVEAVVFIAVSLILLFVCVALHEFGHALMARRLDVVVKNVTLLPIGGMAQIQAVPDKPLYEFLIAAAGPFVNLGLAILLTVLLFMIDTTLLIGFFASPFVTTEAIFLQAPFWQNPLLGCLVFLLLANLALFAFNLIPTFPMDGGRMLRAVLAMLLSYRRATQAAIAVGQLVALSMICGAIRSRNRELMLIALFVLLAGLPVLMGRRRS